MFRNHFALTIDVDSDSNIAIPGRIESVSAGTDRDESRYEGAGWGARQCLEMCAELELPSTWFLEARTARELLSLGIDWREWAARRWFETGCHSRCHEDFTGKVSGMPLDRAACMDSIDEATSQIERLTGHRPQGFRAPYNRTGEDLLDAVASHGYLYDSSIHAAPGEVNPFHPYARDIRGRRLWGVYLPKLRDSRGRPISCYIWRFFEGRRKAGDYVDFVRKAAQTADGGLIQLALHPWHLAVTSDGRYFGDAERDGYRDGLRWILQQVRAMPDMRFLTVGDFVREWAER